MRKVFRAVAFAGLLGTLLAAYLWHNQFPFFYHTDEPGKAEQIISGRFNYHHPLCLMNATQLAVHWAKIDIVPQSVVGVGRAISAVAMMLAIAAIVLMGKRHYGWTFGLLAGAIAGLHPILFEAAHFMKEDCCLLAGFTWTWLALDYFLEARSSGAAIFAGIAAGLAASGKLIGLTALVFTMATLAYWERRAPRNLFRHFICAVIAFAAVFFAINYQLFFYPAEVGRGLTNEFLRDDREWLQIGPRDYFGRFLVHASPLLVAATSIYVIAFFRKKTARQPIDAPLIVFAFCYLALLSFARIGRDRYLIPVIGLSALFAVAGALFSAEWLHMRWPKISVRIFAILGGILVLTSELPATRRANSEFAHDQRTAMINWDPGKFTARRRDRDSSAKHARLEPRALVELFSAT